MENDDLKEKRGASGANLKRSQSQMKSMAMLRSQSRLKVRRQSYGFSGVAGIRPVERTSQIGDEFRRPVLLYFNTYQLEPSKRFDPNMVTIAAQELIEEHFVKHKYNVQESPALALRIAGELMRKVKAMEFNRYRVISIVTIAQRRAQCYNNALSFLWDHERDAYIDLNKDVNTAFIQITVFGIYYD